MADDTTGEEIERVLNAVDELTTERDMWRQRCANARRGLLVLKDSLARLETEVKRLEEYLRQVLRAED